MPPTAQRGMSAAAHAREPSISSTTTTATLRSSVTAWPPSKHAAAAATTSTPDVHWRRLLKRGMSLHAGADVPRRLKKAPPTSNSNSQHSRRQSAQVDTTSISSSTTHPSPVLPTARSGSESAAYTPTVAGPAYSSSTTKPTTHDQPAPPSHQPVSQPRYSVSDQSPTDLLGQRFDSLSVINSFDAISYGSQHPQDAQPLAQSQSQPHSPLAPAFDEPAPQRPAQPTHSASTFSGNKATRARAQSRIEQSLVAAGRRMEDLNARGGDSGTRSPRQRYSDEARETNKLKKKSGFSSFMNNLVGTPRKPTISAPENPVHVTHVGYDQNTGEFTVCAVLISASESAFTPFSTFCLFSGSGAIYSSFCMLTYYRVFLRSGRKRSRQMVLPSKSRRRTHKLSLTSSHSTTNKMRSAVMSRYTTSSTMPGSTTVPSNNSSVLQAVCRLPR